MVNIPTEVNENVNNLGDIEGSYLDQWSFVFLALETERIVRNNHQAEADFFDLAQTKDNVSQFFTIVLNYAVNFVKADNFAELSWLE